MASFSDLPLELQALVVSQNRSPVDHLVLRLVSFTFKYFSVPSSLSIIPEDLCSKNLSLLIWISNLGFQINEYLSTIAAYHDRLDILDWITSNRLPYDTYNVPNQAAKAGHLHILKWIKAEGGDFNCNTAREALKSKQKHVVKWLLKNGSKEYLI